MTTYTILKNSTNGHVEAVKKGYSFAAFALTAVQLGWVWAFAKGAKDANVVCWVVKVRLPELTSRSASWWLRAHPRLLRADSYLPQSCRSCRLEQ
jgi:hypothetical protein